MAKEGKIVLERGKYFVQVGRVKEELVAETVGGVEAIKAIEGQTVEVLYSEPQTFIVALRPKRRPPIICYLPVPWNRLVVGQEHAATGAAAATTETSTAYGLLRRPTCYIPADWLIKGVEEKIRINLAEELLSQGIISQDVHDKIIGR